MRRLTRLAALGTTAGLTASALAASGWAFAPATASTTTQAACHAPAPSEVVRTGPAAAHAAARASSAAPAAIFRVDQIGYPGTARKLAAIMTRSTRAGTRWELISRGSCKVVARGAARRDLGSWSREYPAVWAVPFSAVRRPGTYRLAAVPPAAQTSSVPVVSPWFRIGPGSRLYAGALANALSFYRNERDGPRFIRSALRTAPGHRNDASAMTFRAPKVTQNGNFRGSLRRFATRVKIN